MRMRWLTTLIGLAALVLILTGVNLVARGQLGTLQLDMTQGHIYTLSPATRQVVGNLKQPITLRLFYSPKLGSVLPTYGALEDRVQQMLDQYAALSHGMIRVEQYDPTPYSHVEDRALAYGLQGVPLDQGGSQVYFGLAGTNQIDTERNITFFKPEREAFLEYDLTRLVYELSNPKRPEVGVLTDLPIAGDPRAIMAGQPTTPWTILSELRQTFSVKMVPTDVQVIPKAIHVLMVIQPQKLSLPTQYAIDQFVMRGGRLMLMVDPHSEAEASIPGPSGQPPIVTSSNLHRLMHEWGIGYNPKQVVGDLTGAWRVQSTNPKDRVQAVDYVAWFSIRDGIARNDPATVDLKQVSVASPGALTKLPGAKITFEPLLRSSRQSELLPVDDVEGNPDPAKILASFKPDDKTHVIAARVHGMLHSAFTGPPPLPKGEKRAADLPPYIAETAKPANMVVFADTDMLADRFWVQVGNFFGQSTAVPFADNGALIANVVGTLAGDNALLGLRGRGMAARPFTVVDRMRADADARFRKTQEALTTHLSAVEKQLQALRSQTGAHDQAVLTPAQQHAIEAARDDIIQTRNKLRAVQYDLRRNISALETELRLFDIVLVPAILGLAAILLGLLRARRRARARA